MMNNPIPPWERNAQSPVAQTLHVAICSGLIGVLSGLLAGCSSTTPSELVPAPPPIKRSAAFAPLSAVVTPPPKPLTIGWDFQYTPEHNATDIVFVVRCLKTNQVAMPRYEWPVIGVTNGFRWTIEVDRSAQCCWLAVTASNTVSGLESEFAR